MLLTTVLQIKVLQIPLNNIQENKGLCNILDNAIYHEQYHLVDNHPCQALKEPDMLIYDNTPEQYINTPQKSQSKQHMDHCLRYMSAVVMVVVVVE